MSFSSHILKRAREILSLEGRLRTSHHSDGGFPEHYSGGRLLSIRIGKKNPAFRKPGGKKGEVYRRKKKKGTIRFRGQRKKKVTSPRKEVTFHPFSPRKRRGKRTLTKGNLHQGKEKKKVFQKGNSIFSRGEGEKKSLLPMERENPYIYFLP